MTKWSELKTSECISHKLFYANYCTFITLEYLSGISILPLFSPYLLHVLYRKPISIAFVGNVNVRFTWEHWKDQRQLSGVFTFLKRNDEFFILHYYDLLFLYWVAISNLTDAPSATAHETAPYPFKNLLSEFLFLFLSA